MEVPARHRGQNRRLHPSLVPLHPAQVEVPLAIASASPMRQHLPFGPFGQPSSSAPAPRRGREAGEGDWEKDGTDVSAPGRTPHHEFRLGPVSISKTQNWPCTG